MNTAFVTGGAGFIGSHIVDALVFAGWKVVVVDNLSHGKWGNIASKLIFESNQNTDKEAGGGKVYAYHADIRDLEEMERIFIQHPCAVVIHCAAQISVQESIKQPQLDREINVQGTKNLIDVIKKYPVQQCVYLSSGGAIYGDAQQIPTLETAILAPKSPYGKHKLEAEQLLMSEFSGNPCVTVLRLSNVYGTRQPAEGGGVIAKLFDCVAKKSKFGLAGDGEQIRDFVYVQDVVSAVICALQSKNAGVFNISTGIGVSLSTLLEYVQEVTKQTLIIEKMPQCTEDVIKSILSNNLAKISLNWEPRFDILMGLEDMCVVA